MSNPMARDAKIFGTFARSIFPVDADGTAAEAGQG